MSKAKEKILAFTNNSNNKTNLLEEMIKQEELLITRSNSNLTKCGSDQLDIQEQTPVISKLLYNSSNVSELEKFINEKSCKTALNKPFKCYMDSQRNFFNHLLNKIQFLLEEVRIKSIIIKKIVIAKMIEVQQTKFSLQRTTNNNFLDQNFV